MISQGRIAKPTEALLNWRKYKKCDKTVTLGNVVDRLNSTREKMAASYRKKAAILESLHQASRHETAACGEARNSLFDMKSMRKSLQTQLKNDGHKTPCYEGKRQLSARKRSGPEQAYSAVSLGRLSSVSSNIRVIVKSNENEATDCTKEASRTMPGSKNNQNKGSQSIYSRHMSNVESNVMENSELHRSEQTENSQPKSCITLEVENPETESDESKSNLEYCSESQDGFLSVTAGGNSTKTDAKPPQESISSKEKEVLDSLTDPQLKESLQNIIRRRKSSVRFVKTDTGYDRVNLDRTINEQVDGTSDEYNDQQQVAESDITIVDAPNSDTTRRVKSATIRRFSANRLPSAATSTAGSYLGEAFSKSKIQPSRKMGRTEQTPLARRASSARSCLSSASQRSLSSPILRGRNPEIQTAETRVIRPATAKGYVPNLTNRKPLRKQSAMSSPDILLQKQQAKNLAEVKMIREFLLMYSKVTTKNKLDVSHEPVRMISQTPEFVIKSAIGQFLTRAFPSGETPEWYGLSATSKKERYEEQQRSKLLRIKICMKHLAAVA